MFRIYVHKFNGGRFQNSFKILNLRNDYSQSSKTSNVIKYAAPIAVGSLAGGAGLIAFASSSDENRKNIESILPGSSIVFNSILGPTKINVPKPKIDEGLLKKKLEREKEKEKENVKAVDIKETNKKNDSTKNSNEVQTKVTPEINEIKTKDETIIADTTNKVEEIEPKINENLTEILERIVHEAEKQVTVALSSAEEAAAAIRNHADKVISAIDSEENSDKLFSEASEIGQIKKELVQNAKKQLDDAKDKIMSLQNEIESSKESKLDKENTTFPLAESSLSELRYATDKIQKTIQDALHHNELINEYKNITEKSFKQFFDEIRAIVPEAKLKDALNELSNDELVLLLIHAHKKVNNYMKAIAKLQTLEKDKCQEKVIDQRESHKNLETELENQRKELGFEHRHRLAQLKEEMEIELRTQLKRQAAAHSEHLKDVIKITELELNNKWETKFLDELQKEKEIYVSSLVTLKGQIDGIKEAVKDRAQIDKDSHQAQKLWMACESLQSVLRLNSLTSGSWEDKLIQIQDQIKVIRNAAPENDEFVPVLLESLPEISILRGVFSQDALKERFLNVDRICGRVALIGNNGGSLLRYLLSYLQSIFLIKVPIQELKNEDLDVDNMNTHDILAKVRYCLAKDDLMQAVKYMNLLDGEPRHVSSDWVKEARLHLEVKQVADILMTYAISIGCQAL